MNRLFVLVSNYLSPSYECLFSHICVISKRWKPGCNFKLVYKDGLVVLIVRINVEEEYSNSARTMGEGGEEGTFRKEMKGRYNS